MRKLLIGLIAVVFVALMFFGYAIFMDAAPIEPPRVSDTQDIDIPEPDETAQQTEGTNVRDISEGAKYIVLDPDTKEIQRILGFEKLMNPGMETSRWQVEKPYIIFYESDYQCRIDSDKGIFQVESGTDSAPKDAQLNGNVVIHVSPRPGSKMGESFIKMDDLTFSSERSEFATDGPVSVQSDQVELEGFGLVLILDTVAGQIDYLNIRDLELLRIIDVPGSKPMSSAKTTKNSPNILPVDSESSSTQQSVDVVKAPEVVEESQSEEATASRYYECILADNVEIEYGNELVVAGADQISIQNILFSKLDTTLAADKTPQPGNQRTGRSQKPARTSQNTDSATEVLVRCDGGIILKPMPDETPEKMLSGVPELSVEMRGAPLRIARILADAQEVREPMASCGLLKYTPAEDVLRLFTQESCPEIILSAPDSKGTIETLGNVWWDRKTQQANVTGPGKVYLANPDVSQEPSEVVFNGVMDLLFARPEDPSSSPTIQTINLTGGMNALLKQDGWYKTIADSARLEFGPENSLSQASLQGAVQFESMEKENPQRAVADSAIFEFGPQNALASAYMEGGVRFDSVRDQKASYAQSDTATFYFDQSKIRTADFKGAVSLASDTGKLTSSDVTVNFKPDASGTMQPEVVHTESNAILETVSDSDKTRPAKFEARKIDYDLLTGSGLAHGPVRFTFYQSTDPNNTTIEPRIPIVVTADENAQFIADASGTIKQVVFNKNVLTTRQSKQVEFNQLDTFHGDKLTIFLDKNSEGSMDITGISMTEGKVYAQSQKLREEQVLSNIKLYCTDISYDRIHNVIMAQGPGKIELLNNENSQADNSGFNDAILQPCVAMIDGFDTIRWNLAEEKIVADGQQNQLQLAYIPLVNGKPEKYIYVNSVRFDLSFITDSVGKTGLKRVFTDKVITYVEKDQNNDKSVHTIIGQTLVYDTVDGNGWVKIEGTPAMPCNVDGVRTPFVYVHPVTGKVETSLSTIPGVMETR